MGEQSKIHTLNGGQREGWAFLALWITRPRGDRTP
jgi:hypothetical protein